MKKTILLMTALQLLIVSSYSQFNPVYNWFKVTSGTMNDLNFCNTNYIAGTNGTLLKSTTSGLSWFPINTGSSGNFRSMSSTNPFILIVGNGVLILKSSNDGLNWNVIPSGTVNNLNSIARIGTFNYAAAGNGGVIIYTSNGGDNWSAASSGTAQNLNCVTGPVPLVAAGSNGVIILSTNLGANWNTVPSGTTQHLFGADEYSGTAIVVGAGGTVLRSTDGGLSWQQMPSGTSADLNAVEVLSSTIFAAGNGIVIRSTDNGSTWSLFSHIYLPNMNWKSAAAFNSNEIIVVGPAGNIYKRRLDSLYLPQFDFMANNIRTRISNTGIYNQNREITNAPGFEWPAGSGKTAIFTTGLTVAAYVNGNIRINAASYMGELITGYCVNGNYLYDSRFKIYKVDAARPHDSDWNRWGDMVSFGAPFVDINNNGIYEPMVDQPGMKGAKQTIFVCMTDANPLSHHGGSGEGFSGGTAPLGAEYHFTAWGYNSAPYQDMMFIRTVVINKGVNAWDSTIFSITSDPDLGFSDDDYIGCDTLRNLGYCYNGDNQDGDGSNNTYGINPPAVGNSFLNCFSGNATLTSFCYFLGNGPPVCERGPYNPVEAYNFMKGLKNEGTPWVNIITSQPTKLCYSGDPETGSGWTEFSGRVENCGSLIGPHVIPCPPADRRMIMSYKPSVTRMNPGDSQVVILSQLIARGSNHKNSVTLLKQLADVAKNLCQNGFVIGINPISTQIPETFNLYQNYPNPFNPVTKIKFDIPPVKTGFKPVSTLLVIYDALGREIAVLVNEKLKAGEYSVDWNGINNPSGVYFMKLTAGSYAETRKMVLIK